MAAWRRRFITIRSTFDRAKSEVYSVARRHRVLDDACRPILLEFAAVKRFAFPIVAFCLGAALLWLTIDHGAPAALGGVAVETGDYITQPSATRVIRRTISATGTLKARSTVDVSS